MSGIFISYRRDDSAGHAGRLFDLLQARFGADHVFMDVDTIKPGQNFSRVIEDRIAQCDVMLVLIGRDWLSCAAPDGTRRLDSAEDFVRREISAGLRHSLVIMPVLVEAAVMPSAAQLPAELGALCSRQAITVSDARFQMDAEALMQAVEPCLVSPIAPIMRRSALPHRWGGLGAILFGVGLLVGLIWMNYPERTPRAPEAPLVVTPDLTGQWIAEVPIDAKNHYTIRLKLEALDQKLLGSIDFPTGSGGVHDGRIDGDKVSFVTVHRPQFESVDSTTRFEGRVIGSELELVMQYANVVKRIRMRRKP